MWLQFLLENVHFAVHLFVALVMFAVAWLYVDAWSQRKNPLVLTRVVGYALLSASFFIAAGVMETSVVTQPLFHKDIAEFLVGCTRIFGYVLVLSSMVIEPLQAYPTQRNQAAMLLPFVFLGGLSSQLFPILAAFVGFSYMRRATIGLEDHLKPVSYAFFLLSLSEVLGLSVLFRSNPSVVVYEFVAPFGPVWIAQLVILCLGAVLMGRWVFGYLLKQFETQFFMIFVSMTVLIFMLTTVSYTGLLVRSLEKEMVRQLQTDVSVLSYALEEKKHQIISDAQLVAHDQKIAEAVQAGDRNALVPLIESVLLAKNQSSLIVTNGNGIVLMRGEDKDRLGDSMSDDPLVKRALTGETTSSAVSTDGVVAPILSLRAATPIMHGDTIVGSVLTGVTVDSAFVEGLKHTTGLEGTLFGDRRVSATTLQNVAAGLTLPDDNLVDTVLKEGKDFTGVISLGNSEYISALSPLVGDRGNPVGMLFIAKPHAAVLQTAGKSMELTFLVSLALIMLSLFPAQVLARSVASQLQDA